MQRKGFTLIELLVVIAIIAILVAILFPVFAQAREKARQTSCLSNLKQLNTVFLMYVQDYDETFPFWNWGNSSGVTPYQPNAALKDHYESFWPVAIYPYVKSAGVFTCPSANDKATLQTTSIFGWTQATDVTAVGIPSALASTPINYIGNQAILEGDFFNFAPATLAGIKKPAQAMILSDGNSAGLTGYVGDSWREPNESDPADARHNWIISRSAFANAIANCYNTDGSPNAACGAAQNDLYQFGPFGTKFDSQTRHSGGSVVAFCDGHAKFLRANAITYDLYNGDQAN